jgi:hypothetical protein
MTAARTQINNTRTNNTRRIQLHGASRRRCRFRPTLIISSSLRETVASAEQRSSYVLVEAANENVSPSDSSTRVFGTCMRDPYLTVRETRIRFDRPTTGADAKESSSSVCARTIPDGELPIKVPCAEPRSTRYILSSAPSCTNAACFRDKLGCSSWKSQSECLPKT